MSATEKDVRRYFSKFTSMSNIKIDELPKCEKDIQEIQEIIDAGNFVEVEYDLSDYKRGLAYFFGIGEVRDDEEGLRYLKMAADDSDIDAMNMYGFACYHTSINEKERPEKKEWLEKQAVKWFKEAAVMGQVEAIFNLGVCILEGVGIEANETEGMRYMETALKKGHPRAALYIDEYKEKHGQKVIEREMPIEQAVEMIVVEMTETAKKEGITQIYVMGLFNDIYEEKGYKWIKNAKLGWICSKDDGETYLITENELKCIEI